MIDFIIYFIQCMLLGTTVIYSLKKISNIKDDINNKEISIFILINIIAALSHMYFPIFIKLIYLIFMYMIINLYILKLATKESVFNTLIIIIYFMIGDMIFSLFMMQLYDNDITFYLSVLSFIQTLISCILLIQLLKLKTVIKFIQGFKEILLNNSYNISLTIFYVIELIIYIILTTVMYNITMNQAYEVNLIILFIFCASLMVIFQTILTRVIISNNQREKISVLNSYYIKRIEVDKVYKHNIRNKILSLKSVENRKVNKLIDEILEIEDNKMNNMIQFSNIPKVFLPVVYDKLNNNSNIKLEIINNTKNKKKLKYTTITKLNESIAICLDNVIEECKTNDSFLIIKFLENEQEYQISINNNFDCMVDVDKLSNINYTTKENGTGIGLYSLKKIKGIKTEINIINNIFNVNLSIKK